MRYNLFIGLSIILISCGEEAEQNEEQSVYEYQKEILEDIETRETDFVPKSEPEEGSLRAKLIGKWQNDNDESLVIEITASRYYSIIDGRNGWDQDWDLSTTYEISEGEINDNGEFVQVYLEDGEVFYVQKILEITEDHFTASVESSTGGSGDIKEYTRIY